ncbi:hypothetical protein COCC4DRAFT_180523 [Bipolaris maydis ATCC 48331]|uniref:Peptidase A1 domain-containing protein n=2 Tax=Cochliobolus heterostrophus TaxID=5016 RepID=M2U6W4_COCH5|nr:uncharacterized protein COCC4DRAFT_180523 [Bipolaris maydis ATCC 48331]EMD89481.1 hypothetical protein COCHEDRAFT_1141764 [Bipolaris maydis C5]KAH7552799.1 hypothetical protein BM1_08750 [Bipolaris maydis]ENH99736.1 hypothetical protein COCC4DRAFT_180523 [Bipolaris maydis ATCC 48331]KAJ5025098.1 aspartic peptidase domain-containing protein [Bipolaris maydis]KAJ5057327.1 aspartic peptidase domain-containing protein [Bipolaris maydis]
MPDSKMVSRALLAALALPAVSAELPPGAIAVPLIRDAELDAYYAEFQVGTPPQKEYLKVDTGSPRYSFLNPRNQECVSDPASCTTFGTFDNLTSSTCRYEGPGFYDELYALGFGDYLSDTLVLGGVTMPNMYFGYTSNYTAGKVVPEPIQTILGLSLECYPEEPDCMSKGAYFLPELKNASLIDVMATSMYLGPDEFNVTNAQMIIGGAYDKAKVDGDMFTLEMVDPFSTLTGEQTNYVNVTAMEVVLDGGNRTSQTFGDKGVGVPILLDTGIATWYVTDTIFGAVSYGLGITAFQPGKQVTSVDCKYRDPNNAKGYISVEFGASGKIDVPLHEIISLFANSTCGVYMEPRSETDIGVLADPFIRAIYAIFDQTHRTITMGKAKYTTEQNIVPFPEGGFTVGSKVSS